MACLFCRIAFGELAAERVFENDRVIAFLDLYPIRPGHVQIIPRKHFRYFDDLPIELLTEMTELGQRFARALKAESGVERVAFLFTGGDVPHAHAHVVPLHEGTDITSRQYIVEQELTFRSTPQASSEELRTMGARLRTRIGDSR